MRIKALACEVLARQVYLAAAQSPHVVDVEMLEKGLHDNADTLRAELQRRIDAVSAAKHAAVVLVYGLCNRATEGLIAREVPLVLTRAHDCITLYLGSRERYAAQFDAHPGTYYYSAEWVERGAAASLAAAGAPEQPEKDDGMAYGSRLPSKFDELVRKYGEENARYLLEVYGSWRQHYTRAAYVSLPCTACHLATACAHDAPYRRRVQENAARHGWQYVELPGDSGLVRRLLHGEWATGRPGATASGAAANGAAAAGGAGGNGERDGSGPDGAVSRGDDFVVVPPGATIVATFDERVVEASPVAAG